MWGSAANDVWAVGASGTILHFTGSAWSMVQPFGNGFTIYHVWDDNPFDVWAVGEGGAILHYDGTAWSYATSPTIGDLSDVWGVSPFNIWAVGDHMVDSAFHYDGMAWSGSTSPTNQWLYGLWGWGPNDVYAVGTGGTILRWNGGAWQDSSVPSGDLHAVWGNSPTDVWVVGGDTFSGRAMAHWDGTSWGASTDATETVLWGMWGTVSADVWAVGDLGTILHYP